MESGEIKELPLRLTKMANIERQVAPPSRRFVAGLQFHSNSAALSFLVCSWPSRLFLIGLAS